MMADVCALCGHMLGEHDDDDAGKCRICGCPAFDSGDDDEDDDDLVDVFDDDEDDEIVSP
jgi:hypothetical protein